MKNISKILLAAICGLPLLGITSCDNDKYLAVDHYSILAADQMFKTDKDAKAGLVGCYDLMIPSSETGADGSWGFKPNLFTGSHPCMDTQATGWDKDWNTENWDASSSELLSGWEHAYKAISRCNNFLAGLEASTNITASLKTSLDAQARCVRAFFYMWLAETFGRVPMLATGETYINTPNKARAKTYAEMWDFIIDDLKTASAEFGTTWDPLNGEYGRCTKGFALSYLGEAYMWKAYRVSDEATTNYQSAAACLDSVIQSGKYELNPSYTTLWDPGAVWTKESIWEEVLDEGSQWNSWSNLTDAYMWTTYFTACPEAGGWGSLYLSWEWWSSYEKGDKRRDASGCTGPVTNLGTDHPDWKSDSCYGYNPYLRQVLGTSDLTKHYHYMMSGEPGPSIWSLKYWRTCRANWSAMWGPEQIYYKRYANVLLDYAECLFRLNGADDATAWGYVNQIRERAFGNLEVGKKASLTATYLPYYQTIATFFGYTKPTDYPLPFNETTVTVPDAKTYYTNLQSTKGFSSPAWLVALGEERRKEFNAEWCLRGDLQRSGYIEDHINTNYPKYTYSGNGQDDYRTARSFDYNAKKMDMPIPSQELLKNTLCDQNEAYQ
jgi:starch-binding outer membrane protein, SusD/RagB family